VRTLLVITCVALCGCFQPIPAGAVGGGRWIGPKGERVKAWPVEQIAVERVAGSSGLVLPGWRTFMVWDSRLDAWLISRDKPGPNAHTMIACRIIDGRAAMAGLEKIHAP
jgi:hypothetical protein